MTESTGGIPSTFTITFEPHESGAKPDVDTEFRIPGPVLGKLAEKLVAKRMQREAEGSAQNIEERVEIQRADNAEVSQGSASSPTGLHSRSSVRVSHRSMASATSRHRGSAMRLCA